MANVLVFFPFFSDAMPCHIVSVPLECPGRESARSEEGELVGR